VELVLLDNYLIACDDIKGGGIMAYETKVILIAIGEILRNTKDAEVAYKILQKMANVENVILEPYDDKDEKEKE
jgi:hypothetical protein